MCVQYIPVPFLFGGTYHGLFWQFCVMLPLSKYRHIPFMFLNMQTVFHCLPLQATRHKHCYSSMYSFSVSATSHALAMSLSASRNNQAARQLANAAAAVAARSGTHSSSFNNARLMNTTRHALQGRGIGHHVLIKFLLIRFHPCTCLLARGACELVWLRARHCLYLGVSIHRPKIYRQLKNCCHLLHVDLTYNEHGALAEIGMEPHVACGAPHPRRWVRIRAQGIARSCTTGDTVHPYKKILFGH